MMKRRNIHFDDFEETKADINLQNGIFFFWIYNFIKTIKISDDLTNVCSKTVSQTPLTVDNIIQILTNNPSINDLRRAFTSIRRILSSARDPPIDDVIKAGFLDALAKALEVDVFLSFFFN